jgi:hypothetical protein
MPQEKRSKAAKRSAAALTLDQRLERAIRAAQMHRNTLRYYAKRGWYLRSAKHGARARARARAAERRLASASRSETALRRALDRRTAKRLAKAPPRVAICHVFGRRYCRQALAVAWCESRHSTRAQNGQYLGLFQMGSWERQRFGHGRTAHAQARAAHRYFALTGRDWSPWSCKPWYAM